MHKQNLSGDRTVTVDKRERVLIYGAGGHAKSVISAIEAANSHRIAALVEDGPGTEGAKVMGYAVCAGHTALARLREDGITLAIVAIGENGARARIGQMLAETGFELTTVIHPSAWIAPGCVIGAGSFIHAFAVLGPECGIGQGVIISAQTVVGHDSRIGHWAHLTPGVRIGGNAVIGQGAFLGMGCAVLPRVKIGANASVGANAVVHKNIPDNAVVAGNPARMIRSG
jgi:sugar O-acyltransferase (sialic acid O-acetyltransferase NeuD family)